MIAVVACGNLNRCDDGAGAAVVAELRQRPELKSRADLRLYDAATDGLAVLFQARDCAELLLIDASRPADQPGAIFELSGTEFIGRREPPRDSHALRWDDALTIAQRMSAGQLPARIRVFLIEAQDLSLGLKFSPPVARAVRVLAQRLAGELSPTADPA